MYGCYGILNGFAIFYYKYLPIEIKTGMYQIYFIICFEVNGSQLIMTSQNEVIYHSVNVNIIYSDFFFFFTYIYVSNAFFFRHT